MSLSKVPLNLPKIWLMTDERGGDPVALARTLPRGSGIVFRNHATPARTRRALFAAVRHVAKARRLTLMLAATPAVAKAWGADGAHHRSALRLQSLRSFAVHDPREGISARRAKADLLFVGPVFATRSHPGAQSLGVVRLGLLIGKTKTPVIALGGMNGGNFRRLRGLAIHGWAGIDAFKRG